MPCCHHLQHYPLFNVCGKCLSEHFTHQNSELTIRDGVMLRIIGEDALSRSWVEHSAVQTPQHLQLSFHHNSFMTLPSEAFGMSIDPSRNGNTFIFFSTLVIRYHHRCNYVQFRWRQGRDGVSYVQREKEMMKEDILDSTQNLGNHSTIILVFLTGAPLLPPNW